MWQSIIKAWGKKRVDPGGNPEKGGGIEHEFTVSSFDKYNFSKLFLF